MEIPILNKKYIFIHGGCSIAMLVYQRLSYLFPMLTPIDLSMLCLFNVDIVFVCLY